MKRNFFVIYKYSLLNKIQGKAFLVFTIIFFLVSLATSLVPAIIDSMSEPTKVGVIAEDEATYAVFESMGTSMYEDVEFKQTDATKDFEDDFDFVLSLSDYKIYSYEADLSMSDDTMVDVLFSMFNTTSIAAELNLSNEDVASLMTPPEREFVNLGEDKGSTGYGTFTYIFNYGYTIIGMLVLMIGSQFLGQEIMEEKTTRAMEVIMTSVSSGMHMLAKILSNLTYIAIMLVQGIVFVYIGSKITAMIFPDSNIQTLKLAIDGIKAMISEGGLEVSPYIILFAIVFLLLITLLTLLTFVSAIASSVTTVEEFQNSFGAATMIIMAAYMASLLVTSIDVRIILSYFPIMNFFMLPGLLLSGNVGIMSLLISFSISIVFYILIYLLCIRVYRVGVLNYSAKGVFKVFKQALSFKK